MAYNAPISGARGSQMKIKIIENGPIVLDTEEQVSVEAGATSGDQSGPLFLCRCGHSANKPFCDGSHRRAKFEGPPAELSCP